MKQRKPFFYRLIMGCVRLVYIKYQVIEENSSQIGGNIYVSNHAQIHGPAGHQLYFPRPKRIWIIGEMLNRKEAADYSIMDFWPNKSRWTKWFYILFSKIIISWLAPYIFSNANTIPVFKDIRLRQTINQTIDALNNGEDVIIFPEHRVPYNRFINDFQEHFVDIAKRYVMRTGKSLQFFPMYTCSALKKILIGRPITYNPDSDSNEERTRIIDYLEHEITCMGESLPNHTIVPYENISKRKRIKSKEASL
ncbi:MAG: hypothetical protein WCQ80_01720 [Bacilli bacterium]